MPRLLPVLSRAWTFEPSTMCVLFVQLFALLNSQSTNRRGSLPGDIIKPPRPNLDTGSACGGPYVRAWIRRSGCQLFLDPICLDLGLWYRGVGAGTGLDTPPCSHADVTCTSGRVELHPRISSTSTKSPLLFSLPYPPQHTPLVELSLWSCGDTSRV